MTSRQRPRRPRPARYRPRFEALEGRLLLNTYTVTNLNDSGAGSLRQAILDANGHTGYDTIAFSIGTGPQVIQPLSPLPTITDPALIDGTTQPGYTTTPLIVLKGTSAGSSVGLNISAGGSTVKGLVINSFASAAVYLTTNGGDILTGNYLGTDLAGTAAQANVSGVWVASGSGDTIGMPGAGNVIAGNSYDGVLLYTSGNLVQGNYIGVSAAGTAALGNAHDGVEATAGSNTVGGTAAGAGNVIAASGTAGVYLGGASDLVAGNKIGTNAAGTAARGNYYGVYVNAPSNTIGSPAAAPNVISGNSYDGVTIAAGLAGVVVQNNYIGTDLTGTVALGNANNGISDGGTGGTIGGTAAGAGNLIAGNYNGILLTGGGNLVLGNQIGTNAAGTAALPNGQAGLYVASASNTLGGTAVGAGNLVSGNATNGLYLTGGSNQVLGNKVGTNAAGTAAVPNVGVGLYVASAGNTLGGTAAGAGNLIAGNTLDGIYLTGGANQMLGNYIGTDVTGTTAIGNQRFGVYVLASSNTLGGTAAGAGNLVSGNQSDGVYIAAGIGAVVIQGSSIGVNVTGTAALPNQGDGVGVLGGGNQIGGTAAGAGNLISGNTFNGVYLAGNSNQVQGNKLGTNAAGTAALPNAASGINVTGAGNTVGGTAAGAGNLLSGNAYDGAEVYGGSNLVQGNFIGTDGTHTLAVPNRIGLYVVGPGNVLGGIAAGAGNLIAGNNADGLLIGSNNNTVQGNTVGVVAGGTTALPNGNNGIEVAGSANLLGGATTGAGNLVSGNSADGLYIGGNGNTVQGNLIGTNAAGTAALPNTGNGISVYGTGNTVGRGVAAAANLIAGNAGDGILLGGTANWVPGNLIGTNAAGTAALGNLQGVWVVGTNDTVGGLAAAYRNVISGNTAEGVLVAGGGVTGNVVEGNYIGTSSAGSAAVPNGDAGVVVGDFAAGNTIGGVGALARNVISGNASDGVRVTDSFLYTVNNQILGNYIGADYTGTVAVANGGNGVAVLGGASTTIGSTISGGGNLISGNRLDGVALVALGGLNQVLGNQIGTNAAGTAALPNRNGVLVGMGGNTVGGLASGSRNVISGNAGDGILIDASNSLVEGNYIGTNAAGTAALPNRGDAGVVLADGAGGDTVGGTLAAARNLISGNSGNGVEITGFPSFPANVVEGNYVGTDVFGTTALANAGYGVALLEGVSQTTIGGAAAGAGNVISGNGLDGVSLGGSGNQLQGNLIGTNAGGTAAVPNRNGVFVIGSGNVVGGLTAGSRNVISGNAADGVLITAGGVGNLVEGDYIGTYALGTAALPNRGDAGVFLADGAGGNTVGGTSTAARNVISGNAGNGVDLAGTAASPANVVQGNYVGTSVSGEAAVPNAGSGILVATSRNTIASNTVSGNTLDGIVLAGDANTVSANLVGADAGRTFAVPNRNGLVISGSANQVGGASGAFLNAFAGNTADGVLFAAGATGNYLQRNVIGRNNGNGVEIAAGASANILLHNAIGATPSGALALANGLNGILIAGAGNTVGGFGPTDGNEVVLSGQDGILISGGATGNLLLGNFVGTDYTGTLSLGNTRNGVHLVSASGNTVGGAVLGGGNTIAHNGNDGVLVDTGTGDALRENSTFGSGHLGIELVNGGNHNQAYPVLTSVTSDGSTTTVQGTVTGPPSSFLTLEFFANVVRNPSGFGEGQTFLGGGFAFTDGTGSATFSVTLNVGVAVGQYVSATATDSSNNTSPFAADVVVTGATGPGALASAAPPSTAPPAAAPAAAPASNATDGGQAPAALPVGGDPSAANAAPPAPASADQPPDGWDMALGSPLAPATGDGDLTPP